MFRRLGLLGLLGLLLLPVPIGCMTNRPVIWSWPHNKRRIMTILDDFHKVHMDIDRIVFNMEEYPIEDTD